jgi:Flp pilus assembly protein TadG
MQLMKNIRRDEGQAMTEFALVLPILCILIFAIVQFGVIFNNYETLTDAVRAASRKGAVARLSTTPKSDCENAGYAAGTNLANPHTDFIVTCSSPWTAGSDVTVTATYPWNVNILGFVVASGSLSSTMKERVE